MTTCKKCGRALDLEDSACPECGEPLDQAPQAFFSTAPLDSPPPAAPTIPMPPDLPPPAAPAIPMPPDPPPPNVSYVSPPPQYGYAPPPNASPYAPQNAQPPNASQYAPPNAPPYANYGAPPPQYGYAPPPGYNNNAGVYGNTGAYGKKPKSKVAAGLLAILLGWGIYNFYLKYYVKAVIQLTGYLIASGLMMYWAIDFTSNIMQYTMNGAYGYYPDMAPSLFSPAYVIGLLLTTGIWLWQLIEGILILTGKINRDGAGNPIA